MVCPHLILYIKATMVSVCVGSVEKILPVTARSLEITHLNTLNRAFLIVSVFGHLKFACTGGSPKPRHGIFKDMIFRTRDFSFGTYTVWVSKTQTWKFFVHDFQDVGSSIFGDLEFALWVSKTQKDLGNFRIWFSGHGFQDLGSQLWGLGNFRMWFSGYGFQDLGSQLWGLDFHTRGFQDRNLKTFKT
jgi:hypothetical protein